MPAKKTKTKAAAKRKAAAKNGTPSNEEEYVAYDLPTNPKTLQTRFDKLAHWQYLELPEFKPKVLLRQHVYVLAKTNARKAKEFLAEVVSEIELLKPETQDKIQVKNLGRASKRKLTVPRENCVPVPKPGKFIRLTKDNVWYAVKTHNAVKLTTGVRKVLVKKSYYEKLQKNPPTPVQHAGTGSAAAKKPAAPATTAAVKTTGPPPRKRGRMVLNKHLPKPRSTSGRGIVVLEPQAAPSNPSELKAEDMKHGTL